jgi:hypothetical protein
MSRLTYGGEEGVGSSAVDTSRVNQVIAHERERPLALRLENASRARVVRVLGPRQLDFGDFHLAPDLLGVRGGKASALRSSATNERRCSFNELRCSELSHLRTIEPRGF